MKFFLTYLLLLASFVVNAQNETNLLNSYNYRTKGYLGVDVNGGLISGNQKTTLQKKSNTTNDFNVGFNPTIFGEYNTNKEELSYSINLQSQFNNTQLKIIDQRSTKNNLFLEVPTKINYKRFFQKDIFIGLNFSASAYFNQIKEVDSNIANTTSNFANYVIPRISIGKGRINNVNPMGRVLWILRDLKNEKLLLTDLSETEIIEFANAIVQIDNTRMFDFRKKNKFALKLLIDKIKTHVDEKDLTQVLNVIQDNYYFALNENRSRGEQIYLQAGFSNNYQQNKKKNIYIQEYVNINNNLTPTISLNYNKYKPLSLKKQIEYGASADIGKNFWNYKNTTKTNDTTSFESKLKEDYSQILFQSYFQFGYYFSTRSNIQIGLDLRYDFRAYQFNPSSYITAGTYINYNYMINYRMRLNGKMNADFLYNTKIKNETNRFYAVLNLSYNLR
jgi:hypothetical protein